MPGERGSLPRDCASGSPPSAICSAPATRSRSISARPTAASTSSARRATSVRYKAAYDEDPSSLGPNVRANYEMGARMSLADMAWAHTEQTRIFRRFQAIFRDYDLVLSPTMPVSPFPWAQLYLETLEGTPLRNYYHWLALTYFITLVTNPAISLPCGVDEHGMPFGLQVTRALPRRPRSAGCRRGDGARVCDHPRTRSPAPRTWQACAAAGRAQIDRHPPAHFGRMIRPCKRRRRQDHPRRRPRRAAAPPTSCSRTARSSPSMPRSRSRRRSPSRASGSSRSARTRRWPRTLGRRRA